MSAEWQIQYTGLTSFILKIVSIFDFLSGRSNRLEISSLWKIIHSLVLWPRMKMKLQHIKNYVGYLCILQPKQFNFGKKYFKMSLSFHIAYLGPKQSRPGPIKLCKRWNIYSEGIRLAYVRGQKILACKRPFITA